MKLQALDQDSGRIIKSSFEPIYEFQVFTDGFKAITIKVPPGGTAN